jgi:Fur family ferric uptake transcriptional regulator
VRLTGSRRTLVECVPPGAPFRAEDLWAAARRLRPSVGRATVFRLLGLLVRAGLVERLPGPEGAPCYRLSDGPAGHNHLLTCTGCGRDVPVADEGLERLLQGLTAAQGFRPEGHTLAMFGRCPECAVQDLGTGGEPR